MFPPDPTPTPGATRTIELDTAAMRAQYTRALAYNGKVFAVSQRTSVRAAENVVIASALYIAALEAELSWHGFPVPGKAVDVQGVRP